MGKSRANRRNRKRAVEKMGGEKLKLHLPPITEDSLITFDTGTSPTADTIIAFDTETTSPTADTIMITAVVPLSDIFLHTLLVRRLLRR